MDSSGLKIKIERDVLTESDLEKLRLQKSDPSLQKKFEKKFKKIIQKSKSSPIQFVEYFLPIVLWIRTYKWRKQLKGDIVSGLTVGVMQISQGLAYGELAGLEPITGLYVSLIPALIYAVFGTSRFVHLGTFAVVSLLVSSVLNQKLPIEYAKKYITKNSQISEPSLEDILRAKYIISATLTVTVGLVQFLLYIINGGIVAKLLSPTIVHGFTFAVALQVFSSQISTILGIKIPLSAVTSPYGIVVQKYIYMFKNITQSNIGSILIGLGSMLFLVSVAHVNRRFSKKLIIPIPGDLLLIIVITGLSYGLKFNEKFLIPIVGDIPSGLPSVILPNFRVFPDIVSSAVIIAVVTFAIDVSIAKQLYSQEASKKMVASSSQGSISDRNELKVRPNQELLALSLANIIPSFFQCYVAGSSLARSMVHSNIGGSQLFSFVASIVILIVLLFASKLFFHLPKAILASVVISALVPVFLKVTQTKVYWKLSKREFFIWIVTVSTVFLIGIEIGLGVSILFSLLSYLYNIMKPQTVSLVPISNDDVYKDSKLYSAKSHLINISIFSFQCPLFYLNNETFLSNAQNCIDQLIFKSPSKEPPTSQPSGSRGGATSECVELSEGPSPESSSRYHFIIDFSSIAFVDMASYDTVKKLISYAKSKNTTVYICCTTDIIYQNLTQRHISPIFPTIQDAVTHAQANS